MRTAAVVDVWSLVRGGAEMVLRRQGVRVEVSAATLTDALSQLERRDDGTVDLVVVGETADAKQVTAVQRLAARGTTVVALTTAAATSHVVELCVAGAIAVLGRDATELEMTAALEAAARGERYLAPGMLAAMFDARTELPRQPRFGLTPREQEVLTELSAGMSNDEIAVRLRIGSQTVKTHLTNIYDKLGVRRRSHAVRLALSHGLV